MFVYKSDEELHEDLKICVGYLDTIDTIVNVEEFKEDRLNKNLTKEQMAVVLKDHRNLDKLYSHIKGIREVVEYFLNK